MIKYLKAAIFATTVTFAGAASAAVFNFSDLQYSGGTNWTGTTLPTVLTKCTSGDLCSSNVDASVFGGSMTFNSGALSVVATGFYNGNQVAVVQDKNSAFEVSKGGSGLGVYHSKITSDDNITNGEVLKMSFAQMVNLTNIGLRAEGHTSSWGTGKTFQYSTNGSTWTQGSLQANFGVNLTGKDFYFKFGGSNADQFYLGTMTAVTAVPEPETYAMMLAGLGLMGTIVRRRKAKAA